jgi:hypothetical protein
LPHTLHNLPPVYCWFVYIWLLLLLLPALVLLLLLLLLPAWQLQSGYTVQIKTPALLFQDLELLLVLFLLLPCCLSCKHLVDSACVLQI